MIRDAVTSDAEAISAFWNPMIRDTVVTFNAVEKSASDVAAMIGERQAAGHAFMVAEEGRRILGFASYSQFRGGVGYARTMEHTIILAADAGGRGIGRALMAAIEGHAAARGAHSMIAGVSGENAAGIGFHLALQYRLVAVVPEAGFKFDRWMDLHLMQKLL
jgi:phosphinothricin acetyltransferase